MKENIKDTIFGVATVILLYAALWASRFLLIMAGLLHD